MKLFRITSDGETDIVRAETMAAAIDIIRQYSGLQPCHPERVEELCEEEDIISGLPLDATHHMNGCGLKEILEENRRVVESWPHWKKN